ncbi:peptidylprolyl isomerase [Clostridium sp. MB40-C1]|uniref:peptidylprolyl isomerase n=1 Tax=Clostridium sp. MB40-C1 TaxID=3070996 RepID=UPI0027E2023E|nr:peptidylprolyl isomerase [Clostridium sp. MB40-C1]WMJ80006.1 peptidylprolyl isomerase [Clostridium sp. MB40-C1]
MENKVLAIVNGKEITEKDLQTAMLRFPQDRRGFLASEQGKKQLIEQLVAFELFYNYGKDNGIEETETYKEALEATKRELITQLSIENALKSVEVTDKEVEDYYNANKEGFKTPEMVSAKHILVDTEELANEIAGKIKEGLSFEEAAQEYSTCPSKAQGGNLGQFGRGQMVPEFEEAAFTLEIGTLSQPVKTQFGYHLIKVENKMEAAQKSLDEVKDMIKGQLMQQRQNHKYMTMVEELKGKYSTEIK